MIITLTVKNFLEWRGYARKLISNNIRPEDVQWFFVQNQQTSLFEDTELSQLLIPAQTFLIPQSFMQLALSVSYFRGGEQWALLYQTLWRLTHGEHNLMSIVSDSTVKKLLDMRKAVGRDIHKMKAFVRFKMITANEGEFYLAFYRPAHLVLPIAAPFFQRRFSNMHWGIITPDGSVSWCGEKLEYFPGAEYNAWSHIEDRSEELWLTFYQAIFNPARIKLKAMYNEMPRKYWSTMPETKLISGMLQEAPARVETMLKNKCPL